MRMKTSALFLVLGLSVGSVSLVAHHAFTAEFDQDKPLNLRGTVARMEWVNPHAWLYFDVVQDDGKKVTWAVELSAPNGLIRRGFTKQSVKVGTEIVVSGYQARDGGLRANGRSVTFTDGRRVFVGSSGTGAPDEDR